MFLEDKRRDRTFLLDTGANRNIIDASALTAEELTKIDATQTVKVANFVSTLPKMESLGHVWINVPVKHASIRLRFIVMPARSMNYNLIGVSDVLTHFMPLLEELAAKQGHHKKSVNFQMKVNFATVDKEKSLIKEEEDEGYLTEKEAEAYLETLPTPKCPPEPEQKVMIEQEWFATLWNLFPRLQAEKQNLQEDSRLPYQCEVELKEGARLFFARMYHLSEKSTSEMNRFLKDAEEKGILEKGETRCRSAAFMVARADPNAPQRMVIDFRKFNNMTVPKDANLPRTDQLPNHACRGEYMSKLDLTKGFYHIDVAPRSRELLGIATHPGGYRFRKLPMGFINSPGIFSMATNFVVGLANHWYNKDREARGLDEIPENYLVYIDDILLVNDDPEEHKRAVYYLTYYMARFHLTTNLAKCELGRDSMKFLGRWISKGMVHCAHKHVDAIRKMPLPITIRDMRKWLGIVNFTRPFLPGIAEYQRRLNQVGAGVPKRRSNKINVKWTRQLIDDFVKVRDMIMNVVAISTYDNKRPLYLATDGSDYAIGGIMYQVDKKKRVRSLGFFSKSLNDAQQSYGAVDKELLALEGSVRHFQYLLEGNHCTVYVDHKPLVNILQSKNCNLRFRKLRLLFLSEFDLDIQHIDGVDNEIADYLSRIKLRKLDEPGVQQATEEVQEEAVRSLGKFHKYLTSNWQQEIRRSQAQLLQHKPENTLWDPKNKLWMIRFQRGGDRIWAPDENIIDSLIKNRSRMVSLQLETDISKNEKADILAQIKKEN